MSIKRKAVLILMMLSLCAGAIGSFYFFPRTVTVKGDTQIIEIDKKQKAIDETMNGTPYKKVVAVFGSKVQNLDKEAVALAIKTAVDVGFEWRDVIAIAYKEARFNRNAIHDSGTGFGMYGINVRIHKDITLSEAIDPVISTAWTIKYLTSRGYDKSRIKAIASFNGSITNPKVLQYVIDVDEYASWLK